MKTERTRGVFTLLFVLSIDTTDSGHSLRYSHTAVSVPGHGLPQYTSVGYVDGIQITRYSSDTGRFVPVAPWMRKLDSEYWEEETRNGREAEDPNKQNVRIAMHRFNHTGGLHYFQWMYGCELRDDGSTRGYWQYGYDGKDFLTLDTERRVYYPLIDQAQLSAQRWNSPEQRSGEKAKDYLETDCIKWLRKYLEYGKEELERRGRPEVKVSGHRSGSTMKLHCQVYRFYPRDVDVNWMKNGMDILPCETKHVLPNSDGTYQLTATVEVMPEEGASYSCHVDHSSLKEPLIVTWDSKRDTQNTTLIVGIVFSLIGLAVFITALIRRRKKHSGIKCTSPSLSFSNDTSLGTVDVNENESENPPYR